MRYFSCDDSDGAVLIAQSRQWSKKWVRVKDLHKINKNGWSLHQGPPSKYMELALKSPKVFDATTLFPNLVLNEYRT